jgi:hypothetical protein
VQTLYKCSVWISSAPPAALSRNVICAVFRKLTRQSKLCSEYDTRASRFRNHSLSIIELPCAATDFNYQSWNNVSKSVTATWLPLHLCQETNGGWGQQSRAMSVMDVPLCCWLQHCAASSALSWRVMDSQPRDSSLYTRAPSSATHIHSKRDVCSFFASSDWI